MGDVKDILGLSREGGGHDAGGQRKEKEKEKKELKTRPKGMSREAFNLLHGSHHIQQGDLLKEIEQKEEQPKQSFTKTTYQYIPFKNEARNDDLELRHWVECYQDAAGQTRPVEEGPYMFAKYNVPSGAVRFDDVEYEQVIRPKFPEAESGWSKKETEYLLTLCERFDLRFVVIADRYSWPPGGHPGRARAIEDLKARYYALAAALTVARAGERLLAANQPLVRTPYDAQRERERKEYLRMSFARTPQQAEEEDRLLAQAEQITGARKAALLAKRPSGAPLLHPASFSNSVSEMPFFDHAVTPYAPPKPGVYLRRAALEESKKTALAQQAHGAKASKLLDTVMNDVAQVGAAPHMPTRAAMGNYLALYDEALKLVELKLRGQRGAAKVNVDEGRGKRTVKAKAPRYDESPQPPPSKRNRFTR